MTDHVTMIGRVQDLGSGFFTGGAAQQRRGLPVGVRGGQQGAGQRGQTVFVGHVDARRVGALGAIEVARQRDAWVRQTDAAFLGAHALDADDRVGDQFLDRQGVVGHAVDERGVGAVFQETADQVGQQGLVGADRCVHAARTVQLAVGHLAHDLLVERLAHAVQALELVLARVVVLAGDVVDGRQRVGVVGGELRVDGFRHRQQLAGTGDVGHVGVDLAGVDRIALEALDLGALDLAVPVGALDQADHQAMTAALGQVDDVVDHVRAAFLVGLDDEADTVPARQLRLEAQALEQVQGQLQAVGFLGVDVQTDVVLLGHQGQRQQARVQLFHHALVLGAAVARVQRRELDRDAGAFIDATAMGGLADRVDGLLVGRQVFLCVVLGQCSFAEHVVGVAEALGLEAAGVGQGFGDGFAGDELFAHQAHGHVDALADHRFAALADDAAERGRQARLVVGGDQLAGQQQAPGRGVDEQRRAVAQVRLPVAGADLVADQGVTRPFVRDAQQGFGQAHQGHAFLGGQGEFLQQALHDTGPTACALLMAQLVGDAYCELVGGLGLFGREARLLQQHRHHFLLGATVRTGDGRAQYRLRQDALGELEEALVFVIDLHFTRVVGVGRGLGGQVGQGGATLEFLEVIEDCLLDQPVRRAVDGLRCALESFTGRVVEFDPKGGRRHFLVLIIATGVA